jgi:hypothetical protein
MNAVLLNAFPSCPSFLLLPVVCHIFPTLPIISSIATNGTFPILASCLHLPQFQTSYQHCHHCYLSHHCHPSYPSCHCPPCHHCRRFHVPIVTLPTVVLLPFPPLQFSPPLPIPRCKSFMVKFYLANFSLAYPYVLFEDSPFLFRSSFSFFFSKLSKFSFSFLFVRFCCYSIMLDPVPLLFSVFAITSPTAQLFFIKIQVLLFFNFCFIVSL